MATANGQRTQILFVSETSFGEPSGTAMKRLRFTDTSLSPEKAVFQSNEIRPDRQLADLRHGMKSASGDVTVELGISTYDDLLAGALSGSWAPVTSGALSLAATAAGVVERTAGSWLEDGFAPGMEVALSGFAAANNARARVVAATDLELTLDSTGGLTDDPAAAGRTVALVGQVLRAGNEMKHFTFERGFLDIGQYLLVHGCTVDSMNVDVQPEQLVTATFGFMGKDGERADATMATAVTEPATNSPFSAFEGSLYFGDVLKGIVTGITVELSNGRAAQSAIGFRTAIGISEGACNITGTVSAYFEDGSMLDVFLNEGVTSVEFTLGDPNGVDFHRIRLPRVKLTAGTVDNPREGPITLELPYTATLDPVSGTSMWYQRSNT